jgi:hypothetical protein
MIVKLTAAGRNETIFVNFDYVRTIRREGAFTELVMSDDKYHKLAVMETLDEIYDTLYPAKPCTDNCHCHNTKTEASDTPDSVTEVTSETTAVKKPAVKKSVTKTVEEI